MSSVRIAGGHGAWSRRGCHVMSGRSNSTHTVCSCNHLTNFAILMGKDRYQVCSKQVAVEVEVKNCTGDHSTCFVINPLEHEKIDIIICQ